MSGVPRNAAQPALTWRLTEARAGDISLVADGERVTADWAWGGSTGRAVRVCVVDSGVELNHPRVGPVAASAAIVADDDGRLSVRDDPGGDVYGHGTACASIIRRVAPDCELHSLQVLGPGGTGSGARLLAGLRWAVRQRFDVVNMSL